MIDSRTRIMYRYCKKCRGTTILAIVAMMNLFTIGVVAESTAIVQTTSGPVQGVILSTIHSVKYAAFKGIPYAKPPLGQLRFKPPVPVDSWTNTLNASVEGANCVQPDVQGPSGSEDCLFINVYTPVTNLRRTPRKLKAVMVWIYGGSFTFGTSSSLVYDPTYILEKDIVYVAMNYRLGPLGFLNLGHPDATGNTGLKDQVFALKWVKANIKKFGGNPANVTIFGQSSGAGSVSYHTMSDASAGLFHAAISMSGTTLNPWSLKTPTEAFAEARKLGAQLGTTSSNKATLLDTFRRATAEQLVNAATAISVANIPFVPTIEDPTIATDVFLSTCTLNKYKTGSYNKVPQILGYMDQESITNYGSQDSTVEVVNYMVNVTKKYGITLPPALRNVKNQIDAGTFNYNDLSPRTLSALINDTSNIDFLAGIDLTQQLLAANNGKPVYYYHVSFYNERSAHQILTNISILGASHTDDLGYIFYMPALDNSSDRENDPVARTIDRYSTMWTNFAKYGNPTPTWVCDEDKLNVVWPNSGPAGISLDIGTELKVGPRPVNDKVKSIQMQSQRLLPSANGCTTDRK